MWYRDTCQKCHILHFVLEKFKNQACTCISDRKGIWFCALPAYVGRFVPCKLYRRQISVNLLVPWGGRQLLNTYNTVHMFTTPPSFGTQGRLILGITSDTYSIYRFQYLFSLFYSTGEPADVYKPGGVVVTSNSLQHYKLKFAIFLSHFLDKGVIQKLTDVYPRVSSTGIFLLFPSFFVLTRMLIALSQPTS